MADTVYDAIKGCVLRLHYPSAKGGKSWRAVEAYGILLGPRSYLAARVAGEARQTGRNPHAAGDRPARCPANEWLADALGLTAADADVALRAARGQSREEIAQRRGSTPQTVNAQLKTIFRKADVTREGELVALVNKLLR